MTEASTFVWNETGSNGEVTVTIKYGRGYEEPWAVFRGIPGEIRANILAFFGMEDDPELSLHELVINANRLAQSTSAASVGLGGQVINKGKSGWAAAETAAPAEPERDPLFAKVEATASVDELKLLRAENAKAFEDNAELVEAYKAKGRALKAAS